MTFNAVNLKMNTFIFLSILRWLTQRKIHWFYLEVRSTTYSKAILSLRENWLTHWMSSIIYTPWALIATKTGMSWCVIREVRPRTGCSTCPWKNAPLEKSNKYNFLGERNNSTIVHNHTSAGIVHCAFSTTYEKNSVPCTK